jgi:hypothetical protein
LTLNKAFDKRGDDIGVQFSLPLISIVNHINKAYLFQVDVSTQSGKNMIKYWYFTPHLEFFNTTDLLDNLMILFDFPVFIMKFLKIRLLKGICFWEEYDIMAQLVF